MALIRVAFHGWESAQDTSDICEVLSKHLPGLTFTPFPAHPELTDPRKSPPSRGEHLRCFRMSNQSIVDHFSDRFNGLSLASTSGPLPRIIVINEENWRGRVSLAHWREDLPSYRQYLVLHEFLHALGFGHAPDPASTNDKCSIMTPQTKNTSGVCEPSNIVDQATLDQFKKKKDTFLRMANALTGAFTRGS